MQDQQEKRVLKSHAVVALGIKYFESIYVSPRKVMHCSPKKHSF